MLQFICLFDFGTRTCVVNHDVNDEGHCSSQGSVKKESKDWHELPVFQAKTHCKIHLILESSKGLPAENLWHLLSFSRDWHTSFPHMSPNGTLIHHINQTKTQVSLSVHLSSNLFHTLHLLKITLDLISSALPNFKYIVD